MQERWNDNMKVVIVGGVAGGASVAARARRLDARRCGRRCYRCRPYSQTE